MAKARTSGELALTHSTAAKSKDLWKKYKTLVDKFHEGLEEWARDRAAVTLETLTRALQESMSDPDLLWAAMEALQVVTSNHLAYKQKLSTIDKILTSMEEEVMMAPAGLNPADRDTFQDRQLLVREKKNKQDAYKSWESCYKRLKSDYDQLTNTDGTPRTKPEPGTP